MVASLAPASALGARTLAVTTAVTWMPGARPAGTPVRYDKVGVIKVGYYGARNVLVLEPGTSAGAAYFVPLARWILSKLPGWQVWSVERRENLLEDQSALDQAKQGRAGTQKVFNYYLGFITNKSIKHHFAVSRYLGLQYPKSWGMAVAVQDLRRVITAARKLGGKVVLGGHSLGGSVVTAYATWNFGGQPGARQLAGLVYIDGGSGPPETGAQAQAALSQLNQPKASAWLSFGGIGAPFAGVFNATGSLGVLTAPNARSLGQQFPLLPADLKPPVPVTNAGQYGYALNVGTSPSSLIAAQGHLGKGVGPAGPNGLHGWDGRGALTPLRRFAQMFAGAGIVGADGTEWYFPQRLTDDTAAVGNGVSNPAQQVLGVRSTMARRLPHRLRIYAFGAALGDGRVLAGAQQLAQLAHIPKRNLVLINRAGTYAHNDPAGAFPRNVFFSHLIPFLRRLG
ncbi:MAG TPA: alpha/beta hydrolase [Solirubrobacteraceae bacterium]|nr:alpha/beta hydrolase [Solirubrobacteraceae bacterium]